MVPTTAINDIYTNSADKNKNKCGRNKTKTTVVGVLGSIKGI